MSVNLVYERSTFIELRRRLLELHPNLDDQTLNDTLEGATNLKEALERIPLRLHRNLRRQSNWRTLGV